MNTYLMVLVLPDHENPDEQFFVHANAAVEAEAVCLDFIPRYMVNNEYEADERWTYGLWLCPPPTTPRVVPWWSDHPSGGASPVPLTITPPNHRR